MDGRKAESGKETTQPAATDAGEGPAKKPLDAAPAAADDEEVDDEQVERFYALLANIRAMRGVYTAGGGETAAGSGSGARKRLRSAEPPWKPAFRLEDFEDDTTAATSRCAKKERSQVGDEEREGPVATSSSMSQPSPPPASARRFGSDSKSI